MASDPGTVLRPAEADDSVYAAPLGGSRAQVVQRLQVGLFGLAAMVLLVGLASVIISNRQQNEAQVVPEAAATTAATADLPAPASDPLADAGVVPDMPAAAAPSADARSPAP